MNIRKLGAGMAAAALPLAACGGEAEPIQVSGAVVTRLEWVSSAHVQQTVTYTEFGYCDSGVLFPDDNGKTDLRTSDCTVPDAAYDVQRDYTSADSQNFWRYKIDEVTDFPKCYVNSRDVKVFDDDQAADRIPVEFCNDFDGRQSLPGAEIIYDDVAYYIGFKSAEDDIFTQANRYQWQNVPLGEPLSISISADNALECFIPVKDGACF